MDAKAFSASYTGLKTSTIFRRWAASSRVDAGHLDLYAGALASSGSAAVLPSFVSGFARQFGLCWSALSHGDFAAFSKSYIALKATDEWRRYAGSNPREARMIDDWVTKFTTTGNAPPAPSVGTSFAKYISAGWAALSSGSQPAPPPSPPIDDMRAIHMQALSSVIAENTEGVQDSVPVDAAGNPMGPGYVDAAGKTWPLGFIAVRSQTPPNWSTMLYTNNDVTLVPDARYGQVYRFRTNGQSHNPFWSSPTTCNTSLVKTRPLTVGQFDWYGFAVKWEPGWDWTKVDWSVVFQFGYPTITSPPFGIYAGGDKIYVQRIAGLVSDAVPYPEYDPHTIDDHAKYVDHWLEFIPGIKWGSHADGELHLSMRCKDLGETTFREVFTETGVDTWQWGGALNVPRDASNYNVDDKLDSYYGYLPGTTDDNAPTTYVRHTGHVRCASKAAVLAVMG